jgi:hypothetical protein
MPYQEGLLTFPGSRSTAVHRLKCTERKLLKMNLVTKYNEKIEEYIEKGYAEKLDPSTFRSTRPNLWFIPHFPVVNVHKPDKIRLVFDAAAKSNGKCLNDFLMTGPDLVPSLFGVLCRFRRSNIAFSADIAEMFHQVRIREDDLMSTECEQ